MVAVGDEYDRDQRPRGLWYHGIGRLGFDWPTVHGSMVILGADIKACDWEVAIPFWLVLLLTGAPTAYLFWFDRRHPPHCCQGCGYDLTGNTSGACPECGQPINPAARAS
jgi:hypothetical protein